MNDRLPQMSVTDPKKYAEQKFNFYKVPYIPDNGPLMLINEKNREAAESDIMLVYDLLLSARQMNPEVPITRIYSDDIRYEGSPALDPSMFAYLEINQTIVSKISTHTLLLHYYITPDEKNVIKGDIYYNEHGMIQRYVICFERETETFFIDADGDNRGLLTIKDITVDKDKKRKRFYPLVAIDMHAGYLICCVTVLTIIIATLGFLFINGRREYIADSIIYSPLYDSITETTAEQTTESNIEPVKPVHELQNKVASQTEQTVKEEETTQPVIDISSNETKELLDDMLNANHEPPDFEQPLDINSQDTIEIVSLTSPIARGEEATVKISGKVGVFYTIEVYYSSGISKAAGLETKEAENDGTVEWRWNIGSRTKTGTYKITVKGGGESVDTYITITE